MRTLEPANRVRIGLMGIVVTVLVIGVGQSFTSVPMLFAKPSYYGQFTDTGGINTRRQGAHRRRGRRQGGGPQDRRRPHRAEVLDRHGHHRHREPAGDQDRHHPRQEGPRDRGARQPAATARGHFAAGPKHDSLSDLRRVLRRHQGRPGLGHRHGQAVAACVVGDHRSDLPAPERRARRGGQVLRHDRQARRADQASACPGQPGGQHPR